MSEEVLIKTIMGIVGTMKKKIEIGKRVQPKSYLISGQGAWATPILWDKLIAEEGNEVAAVQKAHRHAQQIGASIVVSMVFDRFRKIKKRNSLSFKGEDIDDFTRANPLVLYVNIKSAEGHLVHIMSFESKDGRIRPHKRLWGEVNNSYKR